MMKNILRMLLWAALLLPLSLQAQLVNATFRTGVDASRWVPLSANATTVAFSATNNGHSRVMAIGFPFYFGDATWMQFSVSTNGRIRLGLQPVGDEHDNMPFSSANLSHNLPKIVPYGCDLAVDTTAGHYVKYELTGTAPYRVLVIEAQQWDPQDSVLVAYQVQLHEDSSKLVMLYAFAAGAMRPCQIGIAASATDLRTIQSTLHTCAVNPISYLNTSWPGSGRYYEFVPVRPACLPPAWLHCPVRATNAELRWADMGASYRLEYADHAITPGTGAGTVIPTVNDTSYTLTGLLPGTTYYAYLRGNCNSTDTSADNLITFTTSCAPVDSVSELPFICGFPGIPDVPCWYYGTTALIRNSFVTAAIDARTGACAYMLMAYANTLEYFALPFFEGAPSNYRLSFWTRAYGSHAGELLVGYMTDAEEVQTFVAVDTLPLPPSAAWDSVSVVMPGVTDTNARLAFLVRGPAWDTLPVNMALIDDIKVERRIPCSCPDITELTCENVTTNAITLHWEMLDDCMDAPTNYEVTSVDTNGNVMTTTVNTPTPTLQPFSPGMTYEITVTPYCQVTGHYGASASIAVTTHPLPCSYYSAVDTVAVGTAEGTDRDVPVQCDYHASFTQLLYRPAEMGRTPMDITHFALHRSAACRDEVDFLDSVDIYFANVDSTVTSLGSGFVRSTAAPFHRVRQGFNVADTGWVEFALDTAFHYDGYSNLLVTFDVRDMEVYTFDMTFHYTSAPGMARISQQGMPLDIATASGGHATAHRCDIRFLSKHCGAISDCGYPAVHLGNVEDTAVALTWTPGYQETSWDVYYAEHGTEEWQLGAAGVATPSLRLTGLHGGLRYDVAVMAVCADSLAGRLTFTTACGPIRRCDMPYVQDLRRNLSTHHDYSGVSNFYTWTPNCWTYYYDYDQANPRIDTLQDINVLKFVSRSAFVSLPALEMRVDSTEINFDLMVPTRGQYGDFNHDGRLIVGVLDTPTASGGGQFVPLDTLDIAVGDMWSHHEVDLHAYSGTGRYVALRADRLNGNFGWLYMRNVVLKQRCPCRRPTAVYADQVTCQSARIVIEDDDNGTDSLYVVYYSTADDLATADSVITASSSVTLRGLAHDATYHVWVRVRCGSGDGRSSLQTCSFVTLSSCAAPRRVTCQTAPANGSALLSWQVSDDVPTPTYRLRYRQNGAATWTEVTTTANYCRLTGLAPNSDYGYRITALCTADSSDADSGSFNMFPSCAVLAHGDTAQVYAPFYSTSEYSYAQSIYLDAELMEIDDTIRGLYFLAVDSLAPDTYDLDVYLGNTRRNAFCTPRDWVPTDSLTLAADAVQAQTVDLGWMYIPLDDYFVRERGKNLIVAIDKNNVSFISPFCRWSTTRTATVRTLADDRPYNIDPDGDNYARELGYYVPDIAFDVQCGVPNCGAPLLANSARSCTSLSLQWFPGAGETAFSVDYRLLGAGEWTAFLTNTTLTAATLQGLESGKTYEVRVRNACSTDSSYYVVNEYSTQCSALPLPYGERYDELHAGEYLRPCWQTGGRRDCPPQVLPMRAASNMLALCPGSYVVAPDFDHTANDLQLHLEYCGLHPGDRLYVGVITDVDSLSSFVPVDTLLADGTPRPVAATVHFDGYAATEGNLCLYVPLRDEAADSGEDRIFLDNLLIDVDQNCPAVATATASNVTATGADLHWRTDGVGRASAYLLEYGPAGFVPGSGTGLTATGTELTLSGLTGGTCYDLYVTPVCTSGDTMAASGACRFTTACGTDTVPYAVDFDGAYVTLLDNYYYLHTGLPFALPPCWRYALRGDNSLDTTAPAVVLGSDGNRSLRLKSLTTLALPTLNAAADTLLVSFTLRSPAPGALVVGTVEEALEDSFLPRDTVRRSGRDTVSFCGFAGRDHVIAFRNINVADSTSNEAELWLDDIAVSYLPTCQPIAAIVRDAATQTSLTIHWDACATQRNYEIQYGEQGFVLGEGARITTGATSATLTGLTLSTCYDVYVRSVCGWNDYGAWRKASFYTMSCRDPEEMRMFNLNAQAASDGNVPAPSGYRYSYSQMIYDSAAMAKVGFAAGNMVAAFAFAPSSFRGQACLEHCVVLMRNSDKKAFRNNTDFDTMQASDVVYTGSLNWDTLGWRRVDLDSPFEWDGHSSVIVAVSHRTDTMESGASFSAKQTSATRSIYQRDNQYEVDPFTLYGLVGHTSYAVSYIPDMLFYGCRGPHCAAPLIGNVDVNGTNVTLMWTGNAGSYEVAVKPATEPGWPAAEVVTGHLHTFTGLLPGTGYDYRVRSLCTTTFHSAWAEDTCRTVGIHGSDDAEDVTLCPNPASGTTTVRLSGISGTASLLVADISGRIVLTATVACGGSCAKHLDLSSLPAGAYFVKVQGDGVSVVKKLIVK